MDMASHPAGSLGVFEFRMRSKLKPYIRQTVLGFALLVTAAAAGASWLWNRHVQAPDPRIEIRTDAEAVQASLAFLAAAQVNTNGFDLSNPVSITKDRFKGDINWRVAWLPKEDATLTNHLVVLAKETSFFWTVDRSALGYDDMETSGFMRNGILVHVRRQHSRRQ